MSHPDTFTELLAELDRRHAHIVELVTDLKAWNTKANEAMADANTAELRVKELEKTVEQRSNAWADLNAMTERQAEHVSELNDRRGELLVERGHLTERVSKAEALAGTLYDCMNDFEQENRRLREALADLLGCPYNVEPGTNPVVGVMHVALERLQKWQEALQSAQVCNCTMETGPCEKCDTEA